MEIGSVVRQAPPGEEEEPGREERRAESEGGGGGSPRVCGEVRRDGVETKKKGKKYGIESEGRAPGCVR